MSAVRDIIREWDNNGRTGNLYFTKDSTLDVTFEDILAIIEITASKHNIIEVETTKTGVFHGNKNIVEFYYDMCDNINNIHLFLASCYLGQCLPLLYVKYDEYAYKDINQYDLYGYISQYNFTDEYKNKINEMLHELNINYNICSFIYYVFNPNEVIHIKETKYLDEYCKDSQIKSARNI